MVTETVICKMCLEPINNYLCVDCLKGTVHTWLDSVRPSLSKNFFSFHNNLMKFAQSEDNSETCVKCKKTTDEVICPYCYEKEVFWWLFASDIRLSGIFAKLFNFDFLGAGYLPHIKTRELEPVMLSDRNGSSDLNVCESCGQESDDLKQENGDWLCESCRD
jgi:DNA-directed RNA polymerase subunit M/transcription elongation factor TFIIS